MCSCALPLDRSPLPRPHPRCLHENAGPHENKTDSVTLACLLAAYAKYNVMVGSPHIFRTNHTQSKSRFSPGLINLSQLCHSNYCYGYLARCRIGYASSHCSSPARMAICYNRRARRRTVLPPLLRLPVTEIPGTKTRITRVSANGVVSQHGSPSHCITVALRGTLARQVYKNTTSVMACRALR